MLTICSEAKSFFDVMGVILFSSTLTCIIIIPFNLFVFEMNDTIDMELFAALLNMCVVLGLTFEYFYLVERITTNLLEIGDIFYNSLWYQLQAKQQQLFVLAIQRAGRELRLTGLGLFDCSLVVFASVCMSQQHLEQFYVLIFFYFVYR